MSRSLFLVPALFVLNCSWGDVYVADAAEAGKETPTPLTTSNPSIPVDQLELLVKPLTKQELQIEADAWFALLRAKAKRISAAQLGVKKTNVAKETAEEDADKAAEEVRKADEAEKKAEAEAKATKQKLAVTEDGKSDDKADLTKTNSDAESDEGAETTPLNAKEESKDRLDSERKKSSNLAAGQTGDASQEDASSIVVAKAEEKKEELLEDVNVLREEQTALVDRFYVVLDSLEEKGGDVEEYRKYVSAVSGITLDVSDTKATWAAITGWLTSKEGGGRWLKNIASFAALLLLAWLVAWLIGAITGRLVQRVPNLSEMAKNFVEVSVRRLVLFVGAIAALAMLEVDITPLLAAMGALGLVVGLALQGTLSNFASGLMILAYRPFDAGDVVEAGGVVGKVKSLNLVSTTFLTFDNQQIVVPNNEIWGNVIKTITANETRRVDLVFDVSYTEDLELVESIMRQVLEEHELVLDDPEPTIKLDELGESSVKLICRPWAKTLDFATVRWDVLRRVKQRFDEEGISIPYPHREVVVRQLTADEASEQQNHQDAFAQRPPR